MDYYYSYHKAHSDASVSTNATAKKKKKKSTKGKGGAAAQVKLSTDPQSVAARERRHRISEKFKALQCLVPGGAKLDTVSMLDEAIHYVKFLKTQIWLHETLIGASAADAYSESFTPQPEWPNPQSCEWSQSSMPPFAIAAEAGQGQDSWVLDMDEVQFTDETTWL